MVRCPEGLGTTETHYCYIDHCYINHCYTTYMWFTYIVSTIRCICMNLYLKSKLRFIYIFNRLYPFPFFPPYILAALVLLAAPVLFLAVNLTSFYGRITLPAAPFGSDRGWVGEADTLPQLLCILLLSICGTKNQSENVQNEKKISKKCMIILHDISNVRYILDKR